tara:strand:+ start:117 stop:938 length:822 start_codon:yes stop_codon:yes gene_type:complete
MKKLLGIVVLGFLLSVNAFSNHYLGHDPNKKSSLDRAFEALEKGQNKSKQRELERRIRRLELERKLKEKKVTQNLSLQQKAVMIAKKGNPLIQWVVGRNFIEGLEGFDTDTRQGKFWMEESAKQYFSPALNYLGWVYYTGEDGIEKDFKKALQYTESASMLGHPFASYNLAFFFFHGQIGLDDDFNEAKRFFIISAEQYLKLFDTKKDSMCLNLPEDPDGHLCYPTSRNVESITEELNLLENNDPKMIKLKEAYINFLKKPSNQTIASIKTIN